MNFNSLPVASILLIICLLVFSSSEDNCNPVPPSDLCKNAILDPGEDGVDCGGTCDPCFPVDRERELIIRNLEVTNSSEALTGDLSFGNLMERLTVSGGLTKDLVLSILQSWDRTDLVINSFNIAPRNGMRNSFINDWKTRDHGNSTVSDADWNMNLDNVPLRLLAITSRVDLENISQGKAGEGRLTFGIDSGSNIFTFIFEYNLAGTTQTDVVRWAKRWHQLSNMNPASPEYLDTLVQIVNTFTAGPSDLSQIRTNEIMGDFGSGLWEFREFTIANNGLFQEVTRKQSPSTNLQNTNTLTQFVNNNRTALEDGSFVIADTDPAMAGNARYTGNFTWSALGLPSTDLAVATLNAMSCVGCHGGLAPGTGFTHIKPRSANQVAPISPFLVGDLDNRVDTINSLLHLSFSAPFVSTSQDSLDRVTMASVSDIQAEEIRRLLERIKNVKRVH